MKMRGLALLVVAVVGLVSCSSNPSSSEIVVTTVTQSSDGVSSTIDNFVASTVSGEKFVLSSALALRPVVLWFWAPG